MLRSDSFSLVAIGILLWLSCGCVYGAVNLESIVGLWLFDDDDPGVATDSSGRGHDGQIREAQPVDGKYGGALQFDGADAVVIVPDAEDLTLSSFTIAAWFNCAGPNNQWQGIAGKDTWPVRNYSLYIRRDTQTLGSNFVHDANPHLGRVKRALFSLHRIIRSWEGQRPTLVTMLYRLPLLEVPYRAAHWPQSRPEC